jgi:hypothetical protein
LFFVLCVLFEESCEAQRTKFQAQSSLAALLAAGFLQSLKIVVKHSSMTNQTHLFRQLNVGRADERATPGTNDIIGRQLCILEAIVLRIDTLIQCDLPD